jgi:hypothetical protein
MSQTSRMQRRLRPPTLCPVKPGVTSRRISCTAGAQIVRLAQGPADIAAAALVRAIAFHAGHKGRDELAIQVSDFPVGHTCNSHLCLCFDPFTGQTHLAQRLITMQADAEASSLQARLSGALSVRCSTKLHMHADCLRGMCRGRGWMAGSARAMPAGCGTKQCPALGALPPRPRCFCRSLDT